VASQDIGPLGPRESEPVMIQWNWGYSFPFLPLWAILLLLFALKSNRHRQAWLILLPLGLVLLVWRMLAVLFSIPDEAVESIGFFVESGVLGWTAVWLLGHWLGTRHRSLSFLMIWGAMFAIDLGAFYCHFEDYREIAPLLIGFGLGSAVLPLAMLLSSFFCRGKYSPLRFSLWLLLWTAVITLVLMLVFFFVMMLNNQPNWDILGFILFMLTLYSVFLTGLVYLINLPFMILAFKSPFFANRFEQLFRIQKTYLKAEQRMMPLDDNPISKEPTAKPVEENDLLGRWEFYVDRLTATVRITFWADGTFSQTILSNQDEVRECPGGAWRLEGAYVHLDGYVTVSRPSSEKRIWWMIDTRKGFSLFGGDDADPAAFFPIRRSSTPT
jgi:hypothetical protein